MTQQPSMEIVVSGPAYVGEPIWLSLTAGRGYTVEYPVTASFEDVGCNKIELKRGEEKLQALPNLTPEHFHTGPGCGCQAPAGAPPNRLPLPLLFRITQPGEYAVRWTDMRNHVSSNWLTFTIANPTHEQKEEWLKSLLRQSPISPGVLVGEFLPAVGAALPDIRAVAAFAKYSNASDARVSGFALAGLKHLTPAPVSVSN